MSVKIVKTGRDARAVRDGDSYIIDVFPDYREESQEITEKMFKDRDRLESIIRKNLELKKRRKRNSDIIKVDL